MKKLLPFLAAVLLVAACKTGGKDGVSAGTVNIQGTIEGVDTGYMELFLPSKENNDIDSIKIEKGKFNYKLDVKEPEFVVIRRAGQMGAELTFFADPGTVEIKAAKDSMWTSEVKAGKTQQDFKEVENRVKNIMMKGQTLYPSYMAAQQAQNLEEMKRIEGEMLSLRAQAQDTAMAWVKQNRKSVIAPYLALIYLGEGKDNALLKSIYDSLSPDVQKTFFARKISEKVSAATATSIGAAAPEFSMNDENGKPVTLSSLRGKYVLIDFWASWCAPCRQENPNVVKAYQAFKDKGFTILGVSLDKSKDAWLKAIKDDNLTWTHVSDLAYWNNAAAKLYGIQSIPANVLLDKEGKIIAKDLRGEELMAKLAEVVK